MKRKLRGKIIFTEILIIMGLSLTWAQGQNLSIPDDGVINSTGTYSLSGEISHDLTLNDSEITVTFELTDDATINGYIYVPSKAELVINGNSHALTVSNNIGGKNESNKNAGTISIKNLTSLKVKNIGGGNGKNGENKGNDGGVCGSGEPGGDVKNVSIENVTFITASSIGGGNGGNGGGDTQYTSGGNGGKGGNANNISIVSSSIESCSSVGGGKGGNGGRGVGSDGRRGGNGGNGGDCSSLTISSIIKKCSSLGGGKGGNGGNGYYSTGSNGTDGNLSSSSYTNSFINENNTYTICGTYSIENFILEYNNTLISSGENANLIISGNSEIKGTVNTPITNNGEVKIYTSANLNGNIISNAFYQTVINFSKGTDTYTRILKDNSNIIATDWNNNELFLKNGEYKISKKNKDNSEFEIMDFTVENACPNANIEIVLLSLYAHDGKFNDNSTSKAFYFVKDKEPIGILEKPTRQYYVFKEWSSNGTSVNPDEKTVLSSDTYYSANWTPADFVIDDKVNKTIEYTYGETGKEFDLTTLIPAIDNESNGLKSISVSSGSLPRDLSISSDYKKITGTPKEATSGGDNKVTITITAKNGATKNVELTFRIAKAKLTVKPVKDQVLYASEAIAYKVEGAVNSEKPEFTGALKVEGGKVVNDNLDLKTEYKTNYTFELESDIAIIDNSSIEAKDVVVSLPTADGEKGWYKNNITFTAPDGFEIALDDGILKSATYAASFDWETEGSHTVNYSLQRTTTKDVYLHTADIFLDKTVPEVKAVTDYLNVTFTLADATSGVASYSYVLDGGNKVEETVADAAKEVQVKLSGNSGQHTIVFTIQDVAGWETTETIAFELKSVPYVPPVVTYYTVTLPEVEGAMTTPKAGSHTVEEGYSFSFSLKLEAGYEQSVPVVTAGGKTIEPRASDGKYVIRSIYEDTEISISGIVKNTPTGNAVIDAGTSIRMAGNTLLISVPQPVRAWVTNAVGIPVRILDLAAGENRVDGLRQGVYIINIAGEKGEKVMVR